MIKKDLKSFFKPDWRKLLGTIILFMTFPFSTKITFCGMGGCKEYEVIVLVGMAFFKRLSESMLLPMDFVLLAVFLAFFYVLSCILVMFYDKLKEYVLEEFVL